MSEQNCNDSNKNNELQAIYMDGEHYPIPQIAITEAFRTHFEQQMQGYGQSELALMHQRTRIEHEPDEVQF